MQISPHDTIGLGLELSELSVCSNPCRGTWLIDLIGLATAVFWGGRHSRGMPCMICLRTVDVSVAVEPVGTHSLRLTVYRLGKGCRQPSKLRRIAPLDDKRKWERVMTWTCRLENPVLLQVELHPGGRVFTWVLPVPAVCVSSVGHSCTNWERLLLKVPYAGATSTRGTGRAFLYLPGTSVSHVRPFNKCVYLWKLYIIKINNTIQLRDRRFCRNSSLQAVCDTPIARTAGCVS